MNASRLLLLALAAVALFALASCVPSATRVGGSSDGGYGIGVLLVDDNDPIATVDDYPRIFEFDPKIAFKDTEYVQEATPIGFNRFRIGATSPSCPVYKQDPAQQDCWAAVLQTMFGHEIYQAERDPIIRTALNNLRAAKDAGGAIKILKSISNPQRGVNICWGNISSHMLATALGQGKYVLVGYYPNGGDVGHAVLVIGATFAMGYPGKYPGPIYEKLYIVDPDPRRPQFEVVDAATIFDTANLAVSFNNFRGKYVKGDRFYKLSSMNDRCRFFKLTGTGGLYKLGCI